MPRPPCERSSEIALHEDVEHMRQQVGPNADAGVAHQQHHVLAVVR
jgi:hypothetical protein